MADREGCGGVVGQSHRNSEEKQTATDARTDTNGSRQTLKFLCSFELEFCFCITCFLLDFLLSNFQIIFFVCINLFFFVQFCITIRLCFCIIHFV